MPYISTKTFTHDIGLSCCFRQWRAESHCRLFHGYALGIRIEFEAQELDARNWVIDFGSLKSFRQLLEHTFDHTMLVAKDDPYIHNIAELGASGLARIVVVDATGAEAFAKLVYTRAEVWLADNGHKPRCRVLSVEVREHGANSAIYTGT